MPDNLSALARDEVRFRQIQNMRQRDRLDRHSADAQALLFTSVRDGFSRSAKLLLEMGVPPEYVGWTQKQADRYMADDPEVASQIVEPGQVASTRLATQAWLRETPKKSVHWADVAGGEGRGGFARVHEAPRGPSPG
ncbi:hypothetical protein [Hydrogenophaga sp.]|uniref:hypothetical protein n=1 Tax=Hydrogenophaga sp. TaxID=1904254 RepID=UPI003F70E50F